MKGETKGCTLVGENEGGREKVEEGVRVGGGERMRTTLSACFISPEDESAVEGRKWRKEKK